MNDNLVFEILELALSWAKLQAGGTLQQGVPLAGILLQIAQKADQAYRIHMRETLDPSLIKAEGL